MKLVQVEEPRPSDEEPVVVLPRPPRPEHRRVYTSLILTVAILVGTVVAVYLVFPPRDHVLATTAADHHREPDLEWDLPSPSPAELRAWLIGVVGENAPLPPAIANDQRAAIGADAIDVLGRRAALVRLHAGADELSYVVARARGVSPQLSRKDGDLHVLEWRRGPWTIVAVGPEATVATWRAAVGAP
jgi:hypothetical protein